MSSGVWPSPRMSWPGPWRPRNVDEQLRILTRDRDRIAHELGEAVGRQIMAEHRAAVVEIQGIREAIAYLRTPSVREELGDLVRLRTVLCAMAVSEL